MTITFAGRKSLTFHATAGGDRTLCGQPVAAGRRALSSDNVRIDLVECRLCRHALGLPVVTR